MTVHPLVKKWKRQNYYACNKCKGGIEQTTEKQLGIEYGRQLCIWDLEKYEKNKPDRLMRFNGLKYERSKDKIKSAHSRDVHKGKRERSLHENNFEGRF